MIEKPDFEKLRAERNESVQNSIRKMAKEMGVDPAEVRTSFNPDDCYCDCGNGGPCEHVWDGPDYVSEDGCLESATCSRCGMASFSHSMRTGR